MLINYYFYSIIIGFIIYIIMFINSKYISKENNYINYIIPLITSLITLGTCFLIENNLNSLNPLTSVFNQQILTDPF